MYGVNLGNWLVLEKWMDSTPFRGTDTNDESWLVRTLSHSDLCRRLTDHRDSYITEKDFDELAADGVELVRLPVPYSVFGDRAPYISCIEYVDKAFEWAGARNMRVLLDLHTVPGSQNGFDNGGLSGVARWHSNENEVLFALGVLERLGARYGHHRALYGIEVLNEPASWSVWHANKKTYIARDEAEAQGSRYIPLSFLERFYKAAYVRLRRVMEENKIIVFHDGFRLLKWIPVLRSPAFKKMRNVAMDTHMYLSITENAVPGWIDTLIDRFGKREKAYKLFFAMSTVRMRLMTLFGVPLIVGEWCVENKRGKEEESSTQQVSDFYLQSFRDAQVSAHFYWSYQLDRDVKKRNRLSRGNSWRRYWDWRMMKDVIRQSLAQTRKNSRR